MSTVNNTKYRSRLTDGNIKVKAFMFSLPPVKSCLNNKSCKDACYAKKAYNQYPSAKNLWDDNFSLVKHDLDALYLDLLVQLHDISKKAAHKRVIRIHQSGDFYNQAYINMWADLAEQFPTILFYGYTKVDKLLDLTYIRSLNNVNIISSTVKVNGVERANFGSEKYIEYLRDDHGFNICPATYGENKDNTKCGITSKHSDKAGVTMCDYCMKCDKVAFLEH